MQRGFFDRGVLDVAHDLLGQVIEHRTDQGLVAIRLTEVEAYDGPNDPGSHAYRGRTARNAVMFGPPGFVYVYFSYGMHWCMNLVCGPDGRPSAVLLRAGEVIDGLELARVRRPTARHDRDLARGPARLTAALGVDRGCDGVDACARSAPLRLRRPRTARGAPSIRTGPRVGLSAAADRPWRYWLDGDPTVSVYRRHQPKKRSGRNGSTTNESSTAMEGSPPSERRAAP